MPVYKYKCKKCNISFEQWVSYQENSNEVVCKKCEKVAKKVISLPTISFKGSGFYKTDNGRTKKQ